MIDFKKFKFGRKKEQDDTTSPANSEVPVQPVHFVEQDVVELDLDDRTSPENDDVLARLGFKQNEPNSTNHQPSVAPEDNLLFPKIPISQNNATSAPPMPANTSGVSAVEQLNAVARAEKNALDALQEERRRNLERLRASIIQSTTASLDLPKEQSRDEFFKTKEESQLEQVQAERKRELEGLRANIAQSNFDLNRVNTDTPPESLPKPRSLDEEFLQFKQAEHLAKQQRQDTQSNDEAFDRLKNSASEGKSFSELDEEFARFRGIAPEPRANVYEDFEQNQHGSAKAKQPQKKRMFTIILGLGLFAGALFAVKHFVLDKSAEEQLPEVVITPTTPPPADASESLPPAGEPIDIPAQGATAENPTAPAPVDAPPADTAPPATSVDTATAPTATTPPATAPVINTTPSKVLVDESILKQPVASDPSLIEEELAKLNELEKQLMEQQANLEAQHQDAEKLIKLKEERIRLLEAQLENKMKNRQ